MLSKYLFSGACCALALASAMAEMTFFPLNLDTDAGNIPIATGAAEFTVELPRPNGGPVVDAAAFGVSAENEDNTAAMLEAIRAAQAQQASRLVLPNGVYRFTSSDWLEFKGFRDFEFDGQGSTLIFWRRRDVPSCLINIMDSERVLFHNFKVDWDWERDPIASRVEVAAVDPEGDFADFRFVDYERFPQRDVHIALIDRMTSDGAVGMGEGSFWLTTDAKPEWLADDLLRVYPGSFNGGKMPAELAPGQYFRMSHYYGAFTGVAMSGNVDLTLRDIDLYSCPGFAFHAYGGQHHWQMERVNIVRKPGTLRPITVSADHVHITKAKGYFKMLDCEMSFGNDDCFNVNDQSRTGLRHGENTLRVTHPSGDFFIGDPVEFRLEDYAATGVTASLTALRQAETPEGPVLEMEFDAALPGRDGERLILFNRAQGSENILIRNCYFHDNRAHGMRLQASNITVENSRFINHPMGIAITTGYTLGSWCEGYGAENIVLRNNLFAGLNTGGIHAGNMTPAIYLGVFLKTDPSPEKTSYPVLSRILIENNRFVNSPGVLAYVSSAADVVIRGNTVLNDRPSPAGLAGRGAFAAAWARDIAVTSNTWLAPARPEEIGVWADPATTSGIRSRDNIIAE